MHMFWGEPTPATKIPKCIALPWYQIALAVKRPPVLSYASYVLWNWKRLDPTRPIEAGNLVLLQNFLGGLDEEWFIIIHVDIEKRASKALAAFPDALKAKNEKDTSLLTSSLKLIGDSLEELNKVLERMPEHCDPVYLLYQSAPLYSWLEEPTFSS